MKNLSDTGPDFKKASRKELKAEFEVLGALVQEHQTKRRKHKRKEEEAKGKCIQLEVRMEALEVLLKRWLEEGDPYAYYNGQGALTTLIDATKRILGG